MIIKKMISVALIAIAVLLVLVMGIAIREGDGFVKNIIETKGSMVVGTAVTLDSVDIDWLGGSVKVKNLAIANPEGGGDSHVFRVQETVLSVEVSSLLGSVIVIDSVVLDGIDIVVEQANKTSNLQRLAKSIHKARIARVGRDDSASDDFMPIVEADDDGEMQDNGKGANLRIENVEFNNMNLTVVTEGQDDYRLSAIDTVVASMGPMSLENIGAEIILVLISESKENVKRAIITAMTGNMSGKPSDKNRARLNKIKSLSESSLRG